MAEPSQSVYRKSGPEQRWQPVGDLIYRRVERGWNQVSEALDYASSRFRDGEVTGFQTVAKYVTSDLASFLETEQWKAKVGGREDVSPFDLRVTSTFRLEDDNWKLVHRHADPITTPHPDGPLRGSTG